MVKDFKGKFIYVDNSDLSVDYLIDFAKNNHRLKNGHISEGQTWLVIDECQIIFNCRCWNDKQRLRWCTFFTQHRKFGYNVILVTQNDRMIDRAIRSLIEYNVIHRKITNYGILGLIIRLFALGQPIFACVEMWTGINEKVDSYFIRGNKRYYRFYDSYKLFDGAVADPLRGGAAGVPLKAPQSD